MLKRLFVSLVAVLSVPNIVFASCEATADFVSPTKVKTQTVNLSENVTLNMAQTLSVQIQNEAKIASNVICQTLKGASYTGSREEWQRFIDSAIRGLLAKQYKDVTLTMVGEVEASYKGKYPNKEYFFTAVTPTGKQYIYNLAVLNKEKNTFYTLSVSGDESVQTSVEKEFKRLVSTFSLK